MWIRQNLPVITAVFRLIRLDSKAKKPKPNETGPKTFSIAENEFGYQVLKSLRVIHQKGLFADFEVGLRFVSIITQHLTEN